MDTFQCIVCPCSISRFWMNCFLDNFDNLYPITAGTLTLSAQNTFACGFVSELLVSLCLSLSFIRIKSWVFLCNLLLKATFCSSANELNLFTFISFYADYFSSYPCDHASCAVLCSIILVKSWVDLLLPMSCACQLLEMPCRKVNIFVLEITFIIKSLYKKICYISLIVNFGSTMSKHLFLCPSMV